MGRSEGSSSRTMRLRVEPLPTVALLVCPIVDEDKGRLHRHRFWAAIARGLSSEDAAAEAGVSGTVGVRWFREGGGMAPVLQAPLSGRYLSFPEREEIAILRARGRGVCEIGSRLV